MRNLIPGDDPQFQVFLADVMQLSPERQAEVLAHMRWLVSKNKQMPARSLRLVVNNTRVQP